MYSSGPNLNMQQRRRLRRLPLSPSSGGTVARTELRASGRLDASGFPEGLNSWAGRRILNPKPYRP